MSTFTIPNVFIANTKIKSASVNANFAAISGVLNTNLLPAVGNASALVTTSSGGNLQSILPLGTEGQTLIVDPTATSTGGLKFASPASGISAAELYNVGLSATATAGALTVALKQRDGTTDPGPATGAALIGIRSPTAASGATNERSVQTALSMTLAAGTTLGMLPSQNNALWVYAIDTDGAGTMALGCSTLKVDEGQLQNVYQESQAISLTIANPAVISGTALPYQINNAFQVTTTGSLPAGISTGANFYVNSTDGSNMTFNSIAQAGSNAATTGSQSGTPTIHVANCQLVSNANYANVAVRLLGKMVFNLTTAGTWIAPQSIEINPSLNIVEIPQASWFNSSQAITGTQSLLLNNVPLFDTHGLVDPTGQFIAPSSGVVAIFNIWSTSAAPLSPVNSGDRIEVEVRLNNVTYNNVNGFTIQTNSSAFQIFNVTGYTTVKVNKGDLVNLTIAGTGSIPGQFLLSGGGQGNTTSYTFTPTYS